MTQTTPVDVVIVGSGPVGCTFARIIAREVPNARILMIESGPVVTDPPGRHVKTLSSPEATAKAQIASQGPAAYQYEPGARQGSTEDEVAARVVARPGTFLISDGDLSTDMPAAAMSRNVGGMGAHWTGACPEPGEGERISFIPDDELAGVFDEARSMLHVTQDAFADSMIGAALRERVGSIIDARLPEGRRVQPMPLAVQRGEDDALRWVGPDMILGDLATSDSDRFSLMANSVVRRVMHENGVATGVLVRDRATGEEFEVRARIVIAACDSFRTPQLLHASGIRPRALGHYLNDHPQAMGLIRLDDALIPEAAKKPVGPGRIDPLSGVNWIPYNKDAFPYHGQVMQWDTSPVPIEGIVERWQGSVVGLGLFGCKDVRYEDQVVFDDDEHDEFGLPSIAIRYTLTEADVAMLDDMRATITRFAGQLGELANGRPPIVMPAGSSLHYMGTMRMGFENDGESVCNSYSALWDIENLFVGGNGVIPTPTACNPTLTSVALAIRSARLIAGKLAVS